MITLYDMALSGNCHKVRLMLSLLALPYQTRPVDLLGGEQRSADYLQVNPFGQVPVLDDDGLIVRDSQAILVYLAKRYGGETWWPDDAYRLAQIAAWLSTAANEIFNGPAMLRVHHKFGRAIDTAKAQQTADKVLGIVDRHLENRDWLANDTLSITDLAIYPYLALAPEGGIDISAYRNIVAWFQRLRAVPGYVSMPGLWQS
jgi:glutathione S-transferase